MYSFALVVALAALLYLIGRAADFVIVNVKILGHNLGLPAFGLGLALGFLTSMPELSVGLQAVLTGEGELSFGNLMGGVIVLLGLVCGLSIVLQREVNVAKSFRALDLFLIAAYILLALILAADGFLGSLDGVVLVLGYLAVVVKFMYDNHQPHPHLVIEGGVSNWRASLGVVVGLGVVLVLAKFILTVTLALANSFQASPFIIGVLLLSVGTNLPEITLAFRAWQSRARDLSLGNLVGSSFANGAIVGVLAWLKPIYLPLDGAFRVLAVFLVLLLGTFVWSAYTGARFNRREGAALVALYLCFVVVMLWTQSVK